ncbi:uncharacterized protein V3H82_005115 isoform 1-T1 [Fundulus diaphanus]
MLVPVTIVQLGDTATMKCSLENDEKNSDELHWYKQTTGNSLKIIVKLLENDKPTFGSEFLASRLNVTYKGRFSNLTIWKTTQEDEGIYHCALINWNKNTWRGTYLLIKGKNVGTSNYRVVQSSTVSDSLHPVEYVTLQCSVLSDFESKTCSGDLSVFWFRSNMPDTDIIYIDGNKMEKYQKKIDQTRSVYNFTKKISSSDAGTYYCAVATCGEILFGNGTNLGIHGSTWSPELIKVIYSLSAVLVLSLIGMALLVTSINGIKCGHCQDSGQVQVNCGQNRQQRDEDRAMYSAAIFTMMKTGNKKSAERKMMFAAVKAFGL